MYASAFSTQTYILIADLNFMKMETIYGLQEAKRQIFNIEWNWVESALSFL